ncbi:MAG: conjugal transfer protein TraC, partial [Proteobacteria bacterium]|nr:conjugal transfer protein TraC [Pseudomonadota bacterium]
AYDQQHEIYVNQDSTFGMIWECVPLTYAGESTMTSLEGIFRAGMPHDSIVQFILHADSHIEPIVELYQNSRTRTEAIITTNTERVTEFLIKGKKGLEACSNIPVRNFRLFVAVKISGDAPGIGGNDCFCSGSAVLIQLYDWLNMRISVENKLDNTVVRHTRPENSL